MMFAAAVGQSMEIVRRETIYRNRNAVQTNPATSVGGVVAGGELDIDRRTRRFDCQAVVADRCEMHAASNHRNISATLGKIASEISAHRTSTKDADAHSIEG